MKQEFSEKLNFDKIDVNGLNSFYGTKELPFDIVEKSANVNFTADFDVRSWGVDGVSISVENFNCEFVARLFLGDLQKDEIDLLLSKNFVKTIYNDNDVMERKEVLHSYYNPKQFAISNTLSFDNSGRLEVEELELNFVTNVDNVWQVYVS